MSLTLVTFQLAQTSRFYCSGVALCFVGSCWCLWLNAYVIYCCQRRDTKARTATVVASFEEEAVPQNCQNGKSPQMLGLLIQKIAAAKCMLPSVIKGQNWSLWIYLHLPFSMHYSFWFVTVSIKTMSSPSLGSVSDYLVILVIAYWLLSIFLIAGYTSFTCFSSPLFSVNYCLILFQTTCPPPKANFSSCAFDYLAPLELLLSHLCPLYLVTSICYWIIYSFVLLQVIIIPPTSMIRYPLLENISRGTSLVAQWLRIRLPIQGTWVRSLVQEDPICHGATKPMRHNYWACALESVSHNYWSPHS